MPRLPRNQLPKLRWSAAHRQYVVDLSRQRHYLGDEPAAAAAEYDRLTRLWLAGNRQPLKAGPAAAAVTLADLAGRYCESLDQTHRKRGKPTSHARATRRVLGLFTGLLGPERDAGAITLDDMRRFRSWLLGRRDRRGRLHADRTVNGYLATIRRAYQWGLKEGLVGAAAWHEVAPPLHVERERGRSRRVLPVPVEDVEKTLAEANPQLAALIRLQLLTGMRPGEVVALRPRDLDRSGRVWVYMVPPEVHKTAHRDRGPRVVPIGPKAQEVLGPWLARARNPDRPVWCTRLGTVYTAQHYTETIYAACDRAGVPRWGANRLRHNRATELRARYGAEAAQVTLGHSKLSTTEIYAERDLATAVRIAEECG